VSAAAADGAITVGSTVPNAYTDFHVLLDNPADTPGIGFDDYAEALAEVIVSGRAEFAVGILGGWGSGKTTLMRAIKRKLDGDDGVVPVWFAAWRYEREPNLILPLLDVLREALEKKAQKAAEGERRWAHDAAVAVTQAGLAFLAGLKLKAGLPGGVGVDLDLGKTIEAIRNDHEEPEPLSFYHAGYQMLRKAIGELSDNGTRRVVIFIDDLDRCLPANALDVLESMKLFFDVEGCVFVVGLDRGIAEKAVAVKYRSIATISEGKTAESSISGSDYVKKLFQVPFTLPPVTAGQLRAYLNAIEQNGGLSEAQLRDFRDYVRPHFELSQGADPVNLREVKRRVNLYTAQLKILSRRLGGPVNRNVVLALLCMSFRTDWEPFYEQLAADPRYVQEALRFAVEGSGQPDPVYLADLEYVLPVDLAEYLRGRAAAVLREENLQAYVSVAEATWTTDSWVLQARTELNRLRRAGGRFAKEEDKKKKKKEKEVSTAETVRAIRGHLDSLVSLIGPRHESSGTLGVLRVQLNAALERLMDITAEFMAEQPRPDGLTPAARWESAAPHLNALDKALLEWHYYVRRGS
jgi:ABC-type oligopeptide transport system ATPase subunit